MVNEVCKICGGRNLVVFEQTATCRDCGILVFWPYPKSDSELLLNDGKPSSRESMLKWYSRASFYNHHNFTNMLRFAMDESDKQRDLDILDFGGGGGQFALVCQSHFPRAKVYITDIADESLLDEWRSVNHQIPFKKFQRDQTKFDVIFLNDVFEHVSDPAVVLILLREKLKPGGRIFIDTPKQFWLYPFTKTFSKTLYAKLLRGTVSDAHLQIWSRKAFQMVVAEAGLSVAKEGVTSEYTMPVEYYLDNMDIRNPLMRASGHLFYKSARYLASNKIICVLK